MSETIFTLQNISKEFPGVKALQNVTFDLRKGEVHVLLGENGAAGTFYVSQVSAGRKCYLNVEVDGSKSSLYWNQEISDWMWKGNRDNHNEQVMRNPPLLSPETREYTYLPGRHPEGWHGALRNGFAAFYTFIYEGKKLGQHAVDFATFKDGHYIMRVTEAIIKSGQERRWVKVDEI